MSRFHLVIEALRRSAVRPAGAEALEELCRRSLVEHSEYIRAHLEDQQAITDWTWTPSA